MNKVQLILLDRDGVVNREGGHVVSTENFVLLPRVGEAVSILNKRGVKVALVTNQSGIARGLLTFEGLAEIHEKMAEGLAKEGGRLDAVFASPWHPDLNLEGGVKEWLGEHEDRKPGAGMLEKALVDFEVEAEAAVMIGDSGKDFEAAKKLGIEFCGVRSAKAKELEADHVLFDSLLDVVISLEAKGRF